MGSTIICKEAERAGFLHLIENHLLPKSNYRYSDSGAVSFIEAINGVNSYRIGPWTPPVKFLHKLNYGDGDCWRMLQIGTTYGDVTSIAFIAIFMLFVSLEM